MIAAPLSLATVEGAAVTDGDEDVLQRRPASMVRMNVARDECRDAEYAGEIAQTGVAARVATLVRTLELDEEAVRAEGTGKARGTVGVAHRDSVPRAAGEADEPLVQLLEQVWIERRIHGRLTFFSFRPRVRMRSRDQPAQVRVPGRVPRQDHDEGTM